LELDDQGWFTMPDTPGLGVELNEDMLEQTLSKTATFH
jgi:L-alanine-DL-glutamate epimerase-like enolase superfamily enzyme